VRKLFSPPGIVFKASGFYTTDYAQAQERKAEKETEKSETTGTG
jgi:predicted nucleic acid-binding Zn ribbon protein